MIKDYYLRKFLRFLKETELPNINVESDYKSQYMDCKTCKSALKTQCPRYTYVRDIYPDEQPYYRTRTCLEIYGFYLGEKLEEAYNKNLITIRKDKDG